MSLSSFTFSGTIKKKPEKRFTPTNIAVTNLMVEVCYTPRGSQLQQDGLPGQVIRVNAWRDLAEECEQKLNAGDKILVTGKAQINAYTNSEGKKRRELEVDANSIVLLNNVLEVKAQITNPVSAGQTKKDNKGKEEAEQISDLNEVVNNTEEIPF